MIDGPELIGDITAAVILSPALADDLIALQRQPKPKLSPATQGSMYGHDNVGFHHH
jgi:hypothetical protein